MTILGIWAHPDDEVFVSGGLMANAARRGERVACIHMTRGEAGLNYGRQCSPKTLGFIRERELRSSLARLGVKEQRFFGYADGRLAQIPSEEGIQHIYEALVELEPDVILTFGPDGFTGHPDHKALSSWVTSAVELLDEPDVQLLHASVSPAWKDSFAPALNEFDFFWAGHPIASHRSDVTLQLEGDLLDAKIGALRSHASQMSLLFDSYGDDFMRALASVEHFCVAPTQPMPRPCGCLERPLTRTALGQVPSSDDPLISLDTVPSDSDTISSSPSGCSAKDTS